MLKEIIEFVKEETKTYDSSHDVKHAIKVMDNVNKIKNDIALDNLHENEYFNPTKVILLSALLHDVCDHKYDMKNEKYSKMINKIKEYCNDKETEIVLDIINNISFSKQKKGVSKNLGKYEILKDIVSDADKLEALGKVGLERCIEFTKNKVVKNGDKKEIINNVVKHCEDKLLILKDKYIKTKNGKKLAIPLHNEILKFYEEHKIR